MPRRVPLLPVHPVPTTFARMGRFGSPFASTDFLAVNPGLAEFDTAATPLDQFRELADAVHTRGARLFIDLRFSHDGAEDKLSLFSKKYTVSPGYELIDFLDQHGLRYQLVKKVTL